MRARVFGWRGVSVAIDGPDGLAQELRDHLPPFFAEACDPIATIRVTCDDSGMLQAELPLGLNTGGPWTPQTLRMLASRSELVIVEQLPDLHAVHAGVVAFDGRAIVLPGTSHSGKSTLIRALLERAVVALIANGVTVRRAPHRSATSAVTEPVRST